MTATLIDGKAIALQIREEVKTKVKAYTDKGHRQPRLDVLMVGDHPPSAIYVRNKQKACAAAGIASELHHLAGDVSEQELCHLIDNLNENPEIDGILPQLPLPKHIDKLKVIHRVRFSKDVDGLSAENQGLLEWNLPGLYPCTAAGVIELLKRSNISPRGKVAAVLGRSLLVGAPTATMLCHGGATTINMHSETPNTEELCRLADIIIVATGVHHLVKKEWVKPGAVVIDVGIHRVDGKIQGDVDFDNVKEVASQMTPVPGGVGPMTIAMLLVNCLKAYEQHLFGEIKTANLD